MKIFSNINYQIPPISFTQNTNLEKNEIKKTQQNTTNALDELSFGKLNLDDTFKESNDIIPENNKQVITDNHTTTNLATDGVINEQVY